MELLLADFSRIKPDFWHLSLTLLFTLGVWLIGLAALFDIALNNFKNQSSKVFWLAVVLLFWGIAGAFYFFRRKALILKI